MDWDDVKIFLAVARSRSVRGAARALGLNHATVSRRMHAFESSLGARLFDRTGAGFGLTPAALEVLATAERMEREAFSMRKRLENKTNGPQGPVSLTVPRLLLPVIAPLVGSLTKNHPGIRITLRDAPEGLGMHRGDTDLTLRATLDPPEKPGSTPVGELGSRVYAHRSLPSNLETVPWIAWAEEVSHHPPDRWRKEHLPGSQVVARVTSAAGAHALVRAGVGAAVLDCVVGDADPELQALTEDPVYLKPIWLIHRPDVTSSPRLRLVAEAVEASIAENVGWLSGRRSRC